MAQEKKWHYERAGEKKGPYSNREIRHMVRTGDILATDLLWKTGQNQPVRAGSIPKLFKQIGIQRHTGPSLRLLAITGLLALAAIVVSPLGDLTSGLSGFPYIACVIISILCLAGAIATCLVALIGRPEEPMVVPTQGRLVKSHGTEILQSATSQLISEEKPIGSSGDASSVAETLELDDGRSTTPAGRGVLQSLAPFVSSASASIREKNVGPRRVLVGMLVSLLAGLTLMQLLTRRPAQHLVSGEVTYGGKGVAVGLIRFTPDGHSNSARPILAGEIRSGRYNVRSGHGSHGGKYTVWISGFSGTPKQVGARTDPLGDELFSPITRTVELPCGDHTLNMKCD